MVIEFAPLEDELGDILEKAMSHAGLNESQVSERALVPVEKIRDAVDYRYELSAEEIQRLAAVLQLNEVGLLALSQGRYPLAQVGTMPFCLYPMRMPYGIGVANAYVVADCGQPNGLLFDTGVDFGLLRKVWPKAIKKLDAIFLTHDESEHIGGLRSLVKEYEQVPVFGPPGMTIDGVRVTQLEEGASLRFGRLKVSVLNTPGHAEQHNGYLISAPELPRSAPLLVSGDVLYAGSIGGAHFCRERLRQNVYRLLETLPENTVVAPGHGPLTTTKNERRYNPFVV